MIWNCHSRSRTPEVRLGSPRLGAWFAEGVLVRGFRLRCLAAAFDLFAVGVLGIALAPIMVIVKYSAGTSLAPGRPIG